MLPTLTSGDTLIGSARVRPRVGRIVVLNQRGRSIIKRVVRIERDQIWIEGDNAAASTDSRQFGYIDSDKVEAVIIWPYGLTKITTPVSTMAASQPAKTSKLS